MRVIAYAGYRGEQEPRFLVIDGERGPVARDSVEIEERWIEPEARCFRVTAGGRRYLLRYVDGDWLVSPLPGRGFSPGAPPSRP